MLLDTLSNIDCEINGMKGRKGHRNRKEGTDDELP